VERQFADPAHFRASVDERLRIYARKTGTPQDIGSWERASFIEKGGWDRMPGEEKAGYTVSRACADGLEFLMQK